MKLCVFLAIFNFRIWPNVIFLKKNEQNLSKKIDEKYEKMGFWPKKVGKWPFLENKSGQ